jgi:hypothetical protein
MSEDIAGLKQDMVLATLLHKGKVSKLEEELVLHKGKISTLEKENFLLKGEMALHKKDTYDMMAELYSMVEKFAEASPC